MKRKAEDVDIINVTPVKQARQQLTSVHPKTNIFTEFFHECYSMYFLHGSYEITRVPDDGNCLLNSCLLGAGSKMDCSTLRKLISASIVQKVLSLQIPLQNSNLIDGLGDSLAPENVIIELLKYESGTFVCKEPDVDVDSQLKKTILDVEMKQGATNPRKRKKTNGKPEFGDKIFEHIVHEYLKNENHKLSCKEVYEIVSRSVEEEGSWIGIEFLNVIAEILEVNIHLYCPHKKTPGKYLFLEQFGDQYSKTALITFHLFELDVNVDESKTR
jgi:hypothetical protein